jgi:hypothetical protein
MGRHQMSDTTPRSVEALVEFWRSCDTDESRAAAIRAAEQRIREVCRDIFGRKRDDEAAR